MIAIVDYDMGNLRSVQNALTRLGAEWIVTSDPTEIVEADKVILPGVGNAAEAMSNLADRELIETITDLRRPVLGICVGMQVMCRHSDEGNVDCMGIFDSHVHRFDPNLVDKVPHIGWNTVGNVESRLMRGVASGSYFYFIHSYYATLSPDTVATCRYGSTLFSAVLKYENFFGTQFHPEKSGDMGELVLENFLNL